MKKTSRSPMRFVTLLGLELIDRLQSDLRIYANRMAGKDSNAELSAKIKELTKAIGSQKKAVLRGSAQFRRS